MTHHCDGRDRSCAGCAAHRDAVVRAAMTLDDQLDDIKRVQIWSRLAGRLVAPAAPPVRWRMRLVLAAAVAASVALVLVALRGDGAASRTFVAPSETTLSLRLGHARASLVGPATLEVVDATPDATSVQLRDGTLLAELEGGHGRTLRISAPGATIEIVGTLFAVAVHGRSTCVSVAHGAVRMTTARGTVAITGGQRACSDGRAPHALDPATRDALAHHAATITAEAGAMSSAATAAIAAARADVAAAANADVATASAAPVLAPSQPSSPTISPPAVTAPAAQVASAPGSQTDVTPPARARPSSAPPSPAKPSRASITKATPPSRTPASPPTRVAASPPIAAPSPATASSPISTSPRVATSPSAEPVAPAIVAPAPAPLAPPPTADRLYRDAEAALAQRDLASADRHLAALLAQFPESALLDQALYERARIAFRRRAWADAQRQLDRLSTIQNSPLREPGAYLACRIAVEAGDGGAAACLTDYRARYPSSPHDADVLDLLAELAVRTGGCPAAQSSIAELARRHPDTARSRGWQRRCPETP